MSKRIFEELAMCNINCEIEPEIVDTNVYVTTKLIVNGVDIMEEINKLKKEIELLKLHNLYKPGSIASNNAKKDFYGKEKEFSDIDYYKK